MPGPDRISQEQPTTPQFGNLSEKVKTAAEAVDTDKNKKIDVKELNQDNLHKLAGVMNESDFSKINGLEQSIETWLANNKDKNKEDSYQKAIQMWNKFYRHAQGTLSSLPPVSDPKNEAQSPVQSIEKQNDTDDTVYRISQLQVNSPSADGCIIDMHATKKSTKSGDIYSLRIPGTPSTIDFKTDGQLSLSQDNSVVQYIDKSQHIQHAKVTMDKGVLTLTKVNPGQLKFSSGKGYGLDMSKITFSAIKPEWDKYFKVQVPVQLNGRNYVDTLYADKNGMILPGQAITVYDKEKWYMKLTSESTVTSVDKTTQVDTGVNNDAWTFNFKQDVTTATKREIRRDAKEWEKQENNTNQLRKTLQSQEKHDTQLIPLTGLSDYFVDGNRIVHVQEGKLVPELDLPTLSKKSDTNKTTNPASNNDKAYITIAGKQFVYTKDSTDKPVFAPFDYTKTEQYTQFEQAMTIGDKTKLSVRDSLQKNYGISITMTNWLPMTTEDGSTYKVTEMMQPRYEIKQWNRTINVPKDDLYGKTLLFDTGDKKPLFLTFQRNEQDGKNSSITINKEENKQDAYLTKIAKSIDGIAKVDVSYADNTLSLTNADNTKQSYTIDKNTLTLLDDKKQPINQISVVWDDKKAYFVRYDKYANAFIRVSEDIQKTWLLDKQYIDKTIETMTAKLPKWWTKAKKLENYKQVDNPYVIVNWANKIDLQQQGWKLAGYEVGKEYLYTIDGQIVSLSKSLHTRYKESPLNNKKLSADGSFTGEAIVSLTEVSKLSSDKQARYISIDNDIKQINTDIVTLTDTIKNIMPELKWQAESQLQELKAKKVTKEWEKNALFHGLSETKTFSVSKDGVLSGEWLTQKNNISGIQTPDGFITLDKGIWKNDGTISSNPAATTEVKVPVPTIEHWKVKWPNITSAISWVNDKTPTWKQESDWSSTNRIFVEWGKTATITVLKDGTPTISDSRYELKQGENWWLEVVKKEVSPATPNQTNNSWNSNTPSTFPKKNSETSESTEELPNFTWARYKPFSKPADMKLYYNWSFYDTTFKNSEVYNHDYSAEFNALVKLINTPDQSYTPEQKSIVSSFQTEINQSTQKYAGDKVKAIQARSAGQWWLKSKDFDTYKLSDGKVGINTYSALLLALYTTPWFADNQTVKTQYEAIKRNFTTSTQYALKEANDGVTKYHHV